MPFEKLSAQELAANPEYVKALKGLAIGEGAKTTTAEEGVGKVTIKQRLKIAADAAGIKLKFHRSNQETVIIERIG